MSLSRRVPLLIAAIVVIIPIVIAGVKLVGDRPSGSSRSSGSGDTSASSGTGEAPAGTSDPSAGSVGDPDRKPTAEPGANTAALEATTTHIMELWGTDAGSGTDATDAPSAASVRLLYPVLASIAPASADGVVERIATALSRSKTLAVATLCATDAGSSLTRTLLLIPGYVETLPDRPVASCKHLKVDDPDSFDIDLSQSLTNALSIAQSMTVPGQKAAANRAAISEALASVGAAQLGTLTVAAFDSTDHLLLCASTRGRAVAVRNPLDSLTEAPAFRSARTCTEALKKTAGVSTRGGRVETIDLKRRR